MRGSAQENPRQVSFPGSGVVSPQLVKFVADFESKILRPVREKRAANDEILAIQSVASGVREIRSYLAAVLIQRQSCCTDLVASRFSIFFIRPVCGVWYLVSVNFHHLRSTYSTCNFLRVGCSYAMRRGPQRIFVRRSATWPSLFMRLSALFLFQTLASGLCMTRADWHYFTR